MTITMLRKASGNTFLTYSATRPGK